MDSINMFLSEYNVIGYITIHDGPSHLLVLMEKTRANERLRP